MAGRRRVPGPAAVGFALVMSCLLSAAAAPLFRDGPPARVTGGFGEDSCFACHWEGKQNDGVGRLDVLGFPATFDPGRSYRLQVELARHGMKAAGFQLAVRHATDTAQAGDIAVPPDEDGRIAVISEQDVLFAQHLLPGTSVDGSGTARWHLDWTAPPHGGTVLLHVSAVAGDADESQMGDYVYTLELESQAADLSASDVSP